MFFFASVLFFVLFRFFFNGSLVFVIFVLIIVYLVCFCVCVFVFIIVFDVVFYGNMPTCGLWWARRSWPRYAAILR